MIPPVPDLLDDDAVGRAYDWLDAHTAGADEPADDDGDYSALLALLLLLGGAATVWRALDDLEASGEPFDAAARKLLVASVRRRRAVGVGLASSSAVQGAYNDGRLMELRRPAAVEARPVWVFDAVLDERTTELCWSLSGTTLVSADPWWRTHTPPLHAHCRSSIRALSAEVGTPRLTAVPSDEVPDAGFGRSPYRFEPAPESYPPALWGAVSRRR